MSFGSLRLRLLLAGAASTLVALTLAAYGLTILFERHAGRRIDAELSVHLNQITQWRTQLLEGACGVFGAVATADAAPALDVKTLHAKIGELTLENDFLAVALGKAGLLPSAKR